MFATDASVRPASRRTNAAPGGCMRSSAKRLPRSTDTKRPLWSPTSGESSTVTPSSTASSYRWGATRSRSRGAPASVSPPCRTRASIGRARCLAFSRPAQQNASTVSRERPRWRVFAGTRFLTHDRCASSVGSPDVGGSPERVRSCRFEGDGRPTARRRRPVQALVSVEPPSPGAARLCPLAATAALRRR